MGELLEVGRAPFGAAQSRVGIAVAVGVLALVSGCASPTGFGAAGAPTPDRIEWGIAQVDVSDVLPGDGPTTALLVTESTVSPECEDDPHADVTLDAGRIFVTVTAMYAPDANVSGGRCAKEATVRELAVELGPVSDTTVLIVNGETWELGETGGFQRCDEYLGCGEPPADPCDGYLARFIMDLDVPQHTQQGVWGCDGTWMAYVIDPATSYCGPSDGESTCDVPSQQRIAILKFDPDVPSWVTVTWLEPPVTCTDIVASVPEMTQATCLALLPAR